MEKSILKKYAEWSRSALLDGVTAKAALLGISCDAEEVAYGWFMRIAMLRFLALNGYLSLSLTADSGAGDSVILAACREAEALLPTAFPKLTEADVLLLPETVCAEKGVWARFSKDVPNDRLILAQNGRVELLGWLYQYYFSRQHEAVIDPLRGKEIKKEDIPVATQVFTPDWVVRYMVDNSLGRYWLERHPESNLAKRLDFLVLPKGGDIAPVGEPVPPQALSFFDPCMGCGHILTYAFDLLLQIYRECGYSDAVSAREILTKNLFGLDIDGRCALVARFCLLLKAGAYDRSILKCWDPPLLAMEESHGYASGEDEVTRHLTEIFQNAKELGSLIAPMPYPYGSYTAHPVFGALARQASLLTRRYTVVCTNPPYLGKYDNSLKAFLAANYKAYSGDLFSVFLYRNLAFCQSDGFSALMTPNVWMFIKTYEKLRRYVIENKAVVTLMQTAKGAFFREATVDICAFVLRNTKQKEHGVYFRLEGVKAHMDSQKAALLTAIADPESPLRFDTPLESFASLPSFPFAYWGKEPLLRAFREGTPLGSLAIVRNGMKTGDNGRFLRYWWEVSPRTLCLDATSCEEAVASQKKWFPYNKGGEARRWYGNNDYVVNWENRGEAVFGQKKADRRNVQDYPDSMKFAPCVTWSLVTSGRPTFRYKTNSLSDIAGMSFYNAKELTRWLLGFCNSLVATEMLKLIAPTVNYQAGDVARLPVLPLGEERERVEALVASCVYHAKADWDARETSWDFLRHPLIPKVLGENCLLASVYAGWEAECRMRFETVKANEEALNRIFLSLYHMEGELSCAVEPSEISVGRTDKKEAIRSLLSYGVGCLSGRYAPDRDGILDTDGAHGENCLLFLADEPCEGDLVEKLVELLEKIYGREHAEDNLTFIASSLGHHGDPREGIRRYFLRDFYKDHLKLYRKRPIYWQFQGGKKGFIALTYLHRFGKDTLSSLASWVRARRDGISCRQEKAQKECRKAEAGRLEAAHEELTAYLNALVPFIGKDTVLDPDVGVKANYARLAPLLTPIRE